MGSIIFQWCFNSGACQRISELGFYWGVLLFVCLVVLNQGCCGCGQYNLPDMMLRLDANTTLNKSYVLFITLVNITYQSRDQYLPSIHSWYCSAWQVLYISLLCFCLNCLSCSLSCVINLTSFLFKSKLISFPICDSAHLSGHCYNYYFYCYNYYFYYYFLLTYIYIYIYIYIYFLHVLFCYYFSFSLFSNTKISLILSSLSILNLFFFFFLCISFLFLLILLLLLLLLLWSSSFIFYFFSD